MTVPNQNPTLSTKEAAIYIGVTNNTLKQSRITGILCGVDAPAYVKMGKIVRYKVKTLDNWLSQFEEVSAQ